MEEINPYLVQLVLLDYLKFVVRDSFCSFNCAHAYNVSLDDHKVWERYALLTRLKNIISANTDFECKRIVCAPPRKMLKAFGGSKSSI